MNYCSILIVDDDIDDVNFLSEALQKCGISEIISVHSAAAALQYLHNCQNEELPKLIVTDVYLPIVNGVAFINELKKTNNLFSIPVIILSTHSSQYIKDVNENLPDADFIKKPDNFSGYLEIANYLTSKIGS